MKWTPLLLAATAAASDVLKLTGKDFDDTLAAKPLALVKFYAPWCGHCKKLAPEFETVATTLKEKEDIAIIKVDCTEEADLCSKYDVKGYPTLILFGPEGSQTPYNGQRTADAIVSYMSKQLLPAVSTLTSETFDDFSKSDKVVAIAFFDKSDTASNETFTKVAGIHREEFLFGASNDAELAEKHGVKMPGVAVFKTFDDGKDLHTGAFDTDSIAGFVKSAAIPLLGEIGPETYQGYMSSGIPLLYLFVEEDEHKTTIGEWLSKIAKEVKGKLNIATIDAKQFGGHAANLNLKETWPAIAIQNTETQEKFPFPQDGEIKAESVGQYIKDFLAGKLSPSIKSEEIPAEQPDHVYTLVQKSFNDIVHDEKRDVLVEYYAPWCGHCKNLAPIYEKLAAEYKGSADKVLIAKIDATNNDTPGEDIKGFPTLRLYPAGKDKKGIEYEGDRSIGSLRDFIKNKGTHQVEGVISDDVEAEDPSETPGVAAAAASMAAKVAGKVAEAVNDGEDLGDDLKDEL